MSESSGRLAARPHPPAHPAPPGLRPRPLGLGTARDGVVVPPRGDGPAPLLVVLHGVGGDGAGLARLAGPIADGLGAIVLAPDSRGATWDVIERGLGPDVAFLDAALARVFDTHDVDPRRIWIAGFSDGASYALTLGLANGDLFGAIAAFSPGFSVPPSRLGRPRIFVSHGTGDRVLPIGPTSRRIVPDLEARGYEVRYVEFEGGHGIPADVAREAVDFLSRRHADEPGSPPG